VHLNLLESLCVGCSLLGLLSNFLVVLISVLLIARECRSMSGAAGIWRRQKLLDSCNYRAFSHCEQSLVDGNVAELTENDFLYCDGRSPTIILIQNAQADRSAGVNIRVKQRRHEHAFGRLYSKMNFCDIAFKPNCWLGTHLSWIPIREKQHQFV
jgi:hypothetical protein